MIDRDQPLEVPPKLTREVEEVEAQLETQGVPIIEARETLDLALKLAEKLGEAYATASEPIREQFNRAVSASIAISEKHVTDYELHEPFRHC